MADRHPDDGPGNRPPSPSDATGRSVDIAGRWERKMASSGLVSGAMVHASKCRLGTRQGMQSPTGLRVWEIHRPTIGLSGTIGRHLSDLSCFLQRQTEAATFALPGQSSDTTRVISAWWQQHLPSLPPTTYICHFCAFGMQATAVVKKTRSTDSKRDR